METKFYIVEAKCGHVGRGNYIIKFFPTKATSRSEAAAKVRRFGRVKHHLKDAIVSVRECTEEEYRAQCAINRRDPYFSATSIQEQRMTCGQMEIVTRQTNYDKPTSRMQIRGFHQKRERQSRREALMMIREYQTMSAYAC